MKFRRLAIFSSLIGLLIVALLRPQAGAAASDFTYETRVNYRIEESGSMAVSETYTVVNQTDRLYLTQLKIAAPTAEVTAASARYSDGTAIPIKLTAKAAERDGFHFDYQEIEINFPRQLTGRGLKWSFTLAYQAGGLVENKGLAHTVYVPQVEAGEGNVIYQVTVDVPESFGNPHFAGARAQGVARSPGRQRYIFDKAEVTDQALALAFGDRTLYRTTFKFPLHNNSPLPRILTATLPPDLHNQRTYIESITPQPSGTRLDADGNILADFRLAPGQSLEAEAKVISEVTYLDYDLGKSGKRGDIPTDLVRRYTKATSFWPTEGPVAEQARKLSDEQAPVSENVRAIYKFVIERLSYNKDKIQFNIRQGAEQALANPANAVCLEYSDLLVAMLRSAGIPARMPVGYAYSGNLKHSASVADSLHSWVEAYVPGVGWLALDPTWGEKFDQFGRADLDHLAFAIWGSRDELPGAITAGGRDLGYQYEQTNIEYQQAAPAAGSSILLAATRWTILPFLSIDRLVLQASPATSSDDNRLVVNGRTVPLGSLAPGQQVKVRRVVLGTAWNSSANARLESGEEGRILTLAERRLAVSYWPSIGLAALVIASSTVLIVLRLRAHKDQVLEPGS